MAGGEPLLVCEDVEKHFPVTQGIIFRHQIAAVKAVDDVSFVVNKGETLGVVGESGCGKSTMARCVMRLLDPTGGKVVFDGRDITNLSPPQMRPVRRDMMMIFQDPYASLNARKRVGFIVGEALQVHESKRTDADIKKRVQKLLEVVGLNPEHYNRFPHEFSGGQRQRIGIARALAVNPKLIVCDEPVSALDVSVQAQILNLLKDLQCRPLHLGPRARHVPRQGGGACGVERALHRAEASVHGRAPLGSADPEPEARPRAPADRAGGRRPEPDQPAFGLRLPPTLPALQPRRLRR